jgi:hypothetical protein
MKDFEIGEVCSMHMGFGMRTKSVFQNSCNQGERAGLDVG